MLKTLVGSTLAHSGCSSSTQLAGMLHIWRPLLCAGHSAAEVLSVASDKRAAEAAAAALGGGRDGGDEGSKVVEQETGRAEPATPEVKLPRKTPAVSV